MPVRVLFGTLRRFRFRWLRFGFGFRRLGGCFSFRRSRLLLARLELETDFAVLAEFEERGERTLGFLRYELIELSGLAGLEKDLHLFARDLALEDGLAHGEGALPRRFVFAGVVLRVLEDLARLTYAAKADRLGVHRLRGFPTF